MTDPGLRGVLDALAFVTAGVLGETATAVQVAREALERDPGCFLDALATTVQMLAEELEDHGGGAGALLRDLGLGIQLEALHGPEPDHP